MYLKEMCERATAMQGGRPLSAETAQRLLMETQAEFDKLPPNTRRKYENAALEEQARKAREIQDEIEAKRAEIGLRESRQRLADGEERGGRYSCRPAG